MRGKERELVNWNSIKVAQAKSGQRGKNPIRSARIVESRRRGQAGKET